MRYSALAPAVLSSFFACASFVSGVAAEPAAKNLNSVPEDNLGVASAAGPDNKFIRQIVNARPNEDLVICVAGCFSGRDRVVYAQPVEKPRPITVRVKEPDTAPPPAAPASPDKALGPSASNAGTPATMTAPKSSAGPPSFDPRAPSILNGVPAGRPGAGQDKSAAATSPASGGTN